jgi:hypothetical protein
MVSHGRRHSTMIQHCSRAIVALLCALLLLPNLGAAPSRAATSAAQASLTYANATLLRDPSNGKIYLFWGGIRHWIMDPATLSALGYEHTSWVPLTADQIASIPDGSTLQVKAIGTGFTYPLAPITSSQVALLLSKPTSAPGHSLSLTGSGFTAGETVAINAPNVTYSVAADGSGGIRTSVPVPADVALGLHHIFVEGQNSKVFGVEVFQVATVTAGQIVLAPAEAAPGGAFGVTGSGFQASEKVQVFLGTLAAFPATADGSGRFALANLPVPGNAQFGVQAVLALGVSSARFGRASLSIQAAVPPTTTPTMTATPTATPSSTATATPTATATRVVPARITRNVSSAHVGAAVLINGYHFAPNELVLVRLQSRLVKTAVASNAGSFYNVRFTIPQDAHIGLNTVSATGARSHAVARASIKVLQIPARLQVSPSTAYRGQSVSVVGGGYFGGERVVLRLNRVVVQVTVSNRKGDVHAQFKVPSGAALGHLSLTGTGQKSGRVGSATLYVVRKG